MRLAHHDLRDMKLAFSLSFDIRRVMYCGLALCWTLVVAGAALGVMSLSAGKGLFSPEGVHDSIYRLAEWPWPVSGLLIGAAVLIVWWAGFGWLTGPVLRSAAMDIARDERERVVSIPQLNRQVVLAPMLAALMPAFAFGLALLWALTTWIPGVVGAIVAALLLLPALAVILFGAASAITALLAAPMMGPCAVLEGRDLFEAVSRPISYLFQRPGRYVQCLLAKLATAAVAALLGALALALAWGMISGAIWLIGPQGLAGEIWSQVLVTGESARPAAKLIAALFWGSSGLLAAWLMAVCLCADVLTYMLMRYRVDGVTFDVITVAEERLQLLPSAEETAEQAEEARRRHDQQVASANDP
jgi:hypothetical protein